MQPSLIEEAEQCFALYGMICEVEIVSPETLEYYISVPIHSDLKTMEGIEMAGAKLAQQIKEFFPERRYGRRIFLRPRLRLDEHWTMEDAIAAQKRILEKFIGRGFNYMDEIIDNIRGEEKDEL